MSRRLRHRWPASSGDLAFRRPRRCQRRKAGDGQHVSVQLLAATDVELKLTTNTKLTHAGTSALFPLRLSASCVLGLTTAVHDEQEHRAPANNPRPFSPDTARHPHPIIFDDSYAAPRFMLSADDRTDAGVPNTTHESVENAVKGQETVRECAAAGTILDWTPWRRVRGLQARCGTAACDSENDPSTRPLTTHARSTPQVDPSITTTAEPPEACVRFLGEERDEGWTPPVQSHAKRTSAKHVAPLNV
ncbi:uncharacterized protein SCHCODRAFT_01201926 [Schizophyllum commune H4-8]|uniref:uncharacterized protein n=1 Tax=Schizophyllum commune (strain H4-8 / FGSC 9210) TaxID=578458 RepID=UPI002160B6A5|nr:uncharacterized protein SCHCODRAFT_01201926 [Schizophyllum commune H4-8]KAI5891804.1 hypothetical protein SCHCODRAFT_01201926 [Schizophyllum commune H4-8]